MDKQIAVYDNTVSARTYLSYIAEQAGGFACIGRDGKLYIRTIGEDTAELGLEKFQDFTWGEQFKVSRVAYEDGVQDFKFGDETSNTIWINSDNMYIVDEEQVENIFNNMKDFECYSFSGDTIIDPSLDVGDIVVVDGKKIIFQGDMEYVGKFKVGISSQIQPKNKEETTTRIPSQKTINRRVQSQINQIDGTITQLVQETSEHSEKISQVEQDVDSINQKVQDIEDLTRIVSGIKKVSIEDAYENENILELHIYGNNSVFDYLYPQEDLYPSDTLYPYGDSRIKFKNSDEERVIELGIDEVLRANDEVKDELSIIGTEVNLIRRVNPDGTTKENEEKTYLGNLKFILKKGINEFEILNYYADIEVKYAIKSTYTDIFATKVEMDSNITQTAQEIDLNVNKKLESYSTTIEMNSAIEMTAEEINSTVSKKVGKDEIISKINQSAEQIQINADKISLERKRDQLNR